MREAFDPNLCIGVLGGGQLGKMLALAAANWNLRPHFLDERKNFPAGGVSPFFTEGDFRSYADVLAFGERMEVLTIEIEHVNSAALAELERKGVKVYPQPDKLDIIKDKGAQKQFYAAHGLPTAPFRLYEDAEALRADLESGALPYPIAQKTRTAGYDGRGVALLRSARDLPKLLHGPCLAEDAVDIDKELAVIVARNPSGEIAVFPTVEMAFHPEANLVEMLVCPAAISLQTDWKAQALASRAMEAFGLCGLLAVELFLTRKGELLINEVAPRPHNSGHHTMDSCVTSQFEQHLRAILDLPLGDTRLRAPAAAMVNLLGAEGAEGQAHYEGLAECLALPGVHIHLYGKEVVRPYRKMGHANVIADDVEEAKALARRVRSTVRILGR
jgi:5-(carboxyamino)imidazole ribonucleotide synthase